MQKKYHLVGAFDRHNYGDILFPLVHTEYLVSKGVALENIKHYAITSANLVPDGGYQTQSIKSLLSLPLDSNDTIVMCGGDILSADWMLMLAHLHSPIFLKLARAARRLVGVVLTNDVSRMVLGEKNAFPYVISKRDCNASIYFTAVGGAGFKSKAHLHRVADELRRTDGLSVRDKEVQQLLAQEGIKTRLVPDTALIMSDFFTTDVLKARDWKNKLKVHGDFQEDKYFSFQGAKRLLNAHLDQLTDEIIKTYRLTGLAPMFVPIGRAPDHEDHVVLEELYRRTIAANIPCAYQDSEHILDIMASLAFARTYVGTSLHGAITTYSFGHKPTALFCDEVKKLKDFLNSWLAPGDFALHETANFAERVSALIQYDFNINAKSALLGHKADVKQELAGYI